MAAMLPLNNIPAITRPKNELRLIITAIWLLIRSIALFKYAMVALKRYIKIEYAGA